MGGRPPDRSIRDADDQLVLVAQFDATRFADVRRQVDAFARRCGLTPDKIIDFVAAVNEVVTNAIRHGGGNGELRLWEGTRLTCEIRDNGPGFAATDYVDRAEAPMPSPRGGMGLWIVQQTSESLAIESTPAGTTVRISTTVPSTDHCGDRWDGA